MGEERRRIATLVGKLGEAITDSVKKSEKVKELLVAFEEEGFEVHIWLDATVGLEPKEFTPASPMSSEQNEEFLRFMKNLGVDHTNPPPE